VVGQSRKSHPSADPCFFPAIREFRVPPFPPFSRLSFLDPRRPRIRAQQFWHCGRPFVCLSPFSSPLSGSSANGAASAPVPPFPSSRFFFSRIFCNAAASRNSFGTSGSLLLRLDRQFLTVLGVPSSVRYCARDHPPGGVNERDPHAASILCLPPSVFPSHGDGSFHLAASPPQACRFGRPPFQV